MKKRISSRYRSLLARGGAVFAILFLLFCETGCHNSKDTDVNKIIQPMTMTEVSTTCTTIVTTVSNSTTSSTSTKTTTTTTVETTSTTQPMTENLTTVVVTELVPETTTEWVEPEPTWVSEDDIILLAKLINHEASASYDGKVMVGSCVVNRMNIKGFSVSDVIFEQGQFTTAYSLSTYTDLDYQAAQQVLSYGSLDTRIYYFDGCHPDGLNWFYDINRNYLGAW